jgi:hypothetical protein
MLMTTTTTIVTIMELFKMHCFRMLNVDQKIILITRLSYYYLEIFQLEMCLLNITMETHHPL